MTRRRLLTQPLGTTRTIGLAALLVLAAGYRTVSAAPPAVTARGSQPKVIAYYFHVTIRCVTCRTIESYAREAIEKGFAKETKNGVIEWRPVNVQLPQNRHFVSDYHLYTRSLVLSKVRDGKQLEWRNLEKVWALVSKKADFFRYVQTNVKECLGER